MIKRKDFSVDGSNDGRYRYPGITIFERIIDRGGKLTVERDPRYKSEDRIAELRAYQRFMKRKVTKEKARG